jgi:hypothetical protein
MNKNGLPPLPGPALCQKEKKERKKGRKKGRKKRTNKIKRKTKERGFWFAEQQAKGKNNNYVIHRR